MRRPAPGFTLLEVLVAVMLTALLTTALFRVYREIQEAQRRTIDDGGRGRVAAILLDRIESELLGTLLVVKSEQDDELDRIAHPWLFLGADRTHDALDADAIRFVTRAPARAPGTQVAAGLRMVTYAAEVESDTLALYRYEEDLPEGLEKELGAGGIEGPPVVHDLAHFSLRYLDEETGEWVDAWDSSDISRLDRLPDKVEINVALLAPDENGELAPGEEYQRVVKLPVRPIDPRPAEDEEGAQCGEGGTVAACMDRTGPGPSAIERHGFQQLRDRYGERCFADIAGTPAEDELEEAGIDTGECE
jgi:prepilin-type N-terminal cleavage/methylation domain-containing protein